jgi:phage gp29-like protein
LEAKRAAGGDYSVFIQRWTQLIYRLCLGQSFSVDGAGGQYKGDNLMDVAGWIIKADADVINPSFVHSAVTWLRDWNYPDAALPGVWRRTEDAPDLKALSETQKNLLAVGYRPTPDKVKEDYGEGWEPVQTATPPTDPGAGSGPADKLRAGIARNKAADAAAQFAEPTEAPETPDLQVEQLGQRAAPLLDRMLARAHKLMDECADMAELERRIGDLYGEMDSSEMAALLGEAFMASELAGRFEASDGR